MQFMRQLIDRIGGVDVVVERTIDDPHYRDDVTGTRGFFILAGPQHLDGETAMAYVRSRMASGESDFTRAARQQQVLTAIAEKLTGGNLLLTLPALMSTIRDNVSTDIPSARVETVAAGVDTAGRHPRHGGASLRLSATDRSLAPGRVTDGGHPAVSPVAGPRARRRRPPGENRRSAPS